MSLPQGHDEGQEPGRDDEHPGTPSEVDRALLEVVRACMTISLQAADRIDRTSVVQLRALTLLSGNGPMSLVDFATHMGVTASTASRLVDRLVAADLADRRIAPHSRRHVEIRPTQRGQATVDTYDRLRLDDLHGRLATLTEELQRTVLHCLPALGSAMRQPLAVPTRTPPT